jgi:putative ABC transport system permease protein
MRIRDFVSMALLTISRQKTRTALSLIGIVIGSLLLLFSLAARRGVQDAVARVFSMRREMRQISVHPRWSLDDSKAPEAELRVNGDMDDGMRSRIRAMLLRQWRMQNSTGHVALTEERIAGIAALPHVQGVYPDTSLFVSLVQGTHLLRGSGTSLPLNDEVLRDRILVGDAFVSESDRAILLNEFVAWKWGCDSLERMQELIGTKVRIENRDAEQAVASSLSHFSGSGMEFDPEEVAALNRALERLPAVVDHLPLAEDERAVL